MYKFYTRKLGVPERLYHKIWLIMRLTTVILIASLMQVSAATFAQRITLNQRNTPLESVFKEIRKQSGYDFFYDGKAIKPTQRVSISVTDVSVEDALRSILKDLPFTYEINDNRITIRKKEEPSFLDNVKAAFAVIDVHGRVVDEKGQPLPGVTIKLKDESQVTSTDKDGNFTLKRVDEKSIIVVSFIGYLTKEINAKSEAGTISLEISNSKLDEVQIQAYGVTSRRLSTSNIGTVKADDISKQPVNNPLLALQGRVSGITINEANGLPGGGISVRIQGQNSLTNGNDPLYVIDGVPYPSQTLPNLGNILGSSGNTTTAIPTGNGNTLSFINPSDIESIDILKDADATAIYGSRAGNGAILITTKKGKVGDSKLSLNLQSGMSEVGKKLSLLNTQQYLEMRNEALKNDNLTIQPSDYDLNGTWSKNNNTDWQKTLIGGTGKYYDFQSSYSGGNVNTQFFISSGYHRQTTVFPGNFADQKGSLHFNINNQSVNKRFKLQFSGGFLIDNNQLPSNDLTNLAITLPPNAPNLYNSDGSLNWASDQTGTSSWINPLSYTMNRYKQTTSNLLSNLLLEYQLLPGLKLKSSFGYNDLLSNELQVYPLTGVAPENRQYYTGGGAAGYSTNHVSSWIIEPQITYNRQVGRGKIDFLLGSTLQNRNSNGEQISASGFTSDLLLEDIHSASTLYTEPSILATYKYEALFSRINFNYDDKYIVNLTARRDGSSRFGSENEFHNFASLASAWIFSNEDFFKEFHLLSYGKLRVSYGTTGNDQIGDYRNLNLYNTLGVARNYQGISSLIVTNLSNPFLQWEETKKFQFGIDLGFFNDRVLLNANYNDNQSSNQLLSSALPITTGFNSIATNFPATVRNYGWEASITTENLRGKTFSWSSSFNITIAKNKLIKFDNIEKSSYSNQYIVGQPITIQKAYHSLGVDKETGLYIFADASGNITNSPNELSDKTIIENTTPSFYGGFSNRFTFKGLSLECLFTFVKQKSASYSFGAYPGSFYVNQPISVLNRWQNPGDVASVQKYNSDYNLFNQAFAHDQSDAVWKDASFVRLKNLSLSWRLPQNILKLKNNDSFTVFAQGQNLLTFTGYSGLDPETKSLFSLPPLRVITFGLKLEL